MRLMNSGGDGREADGRGKVTFWEVRAARVKPHLKSKQFTWGCQNNQICDHSIRCAGEIAEIGKVEKASWGRAIVLYLRFGLYFEGNRKATVIF